MNKENRFDIIIVGGGLAGLTAANHLAQNKRKVLVIEKRGYPRHKVCGEYISNEVLPYLISLGIDPIQQGAKQISELEITTRDNKKVKSKLPLGGFGISRYSLDHLISKQAVSSGALIVIETVTHIEFLDDFFSVTTQNEKYSSKFVIGSYGKRSNLDKALNRKFIKTQSNYLGVKIHVEGNFPENKVALHNFKGGYCGVSKVENNHINLCYITDYKSFKKHKSILEFQERVLYKNKELKKIFTQSRSIFEEPLTISQISFDKKPVIENHILMCGDAAAMIHPLCGNGMAMAINGARIVSEAVIDFFEGNIKSRKQLEKMYLTHWNRQFRVRLFFGHKIATIFRSDFGTNILLNLVRFFPFLIKMIIKNTHGKI